MTSSLRVPALLLWLAFLWVTLWGDLTWGNIVGGVAVSAVVLLFARPTGAVRLDRNEFHPIAAIHYALYFAIQLVQSNLVVAWQILSPGKHDRAIVEVRMHTRAPGVVTLLANSITLTPGTVTVDVRTDRIEDAGEGRDRSAVEYLLYIHVLDLESVETVRRDVYRLERLAVRAFGSRADLASIDADLAGLGAGGPP